MTTFLKQLDCRVVLGGQIPDAAVGSKEKIHEHMSSCVAFVQLLCGNHAVGGLAELEFAVAKQVFELDSILLWRRQHDSRTGNGNEFSGDELSVCSGEIEEFKSFLADRLVRLASRKKLLASRTLPQSPGLPQGSGIEFVLLKASESDEAVAAELAKLLVSSDIGFDLDLNGLALNEAFDACEYDGLLLVYGACPRSGCKNAFASVAM